MKTLQDLLKKEEIYTAKCDDGDAFFDAVENVHVVAAAESYYRQAYLGSATTWNVRDQAMADTVERTIKFFQKRKRETYNHSIDER